MWRHIDSLSMQWLSRVIDYLIDLTLRFHTFVIPHTISSAMHWAAASAAVLGRNCRGASLNPLIMQTILDFANRGQEVEQYLFQSNRVRLQVVKPRFCSIRRKDPIGSLVPSGNTRESTVSRMSNLLSVEQVWDVTISPYVAHTPVAKS